MGKLKDQLAGIAALIAAVVAIGGGFVKYGEITTKLDALESQEQSVVDTSTIESSIAVLEEKVSKLENVDTSHTHELVDHKHDLTDHKHDLVEHKHDLVEHDHPVEHGHTKTLVNEKEIELLKVQIEEIKVKATNPLAN
jgi:Ulp1 family protease